MSQLALYATVLLPIMLAALAIRPGARQLVLNLAAAAPLPALVLAFLAPEARLTGSWLLMETTLGLEPVGRTFLAFTAILWCAAAITARRWMRDDPHATSFVVAFLLAMAGNFGLIVAQDALSFYAFFALMSFASYGMVVHARGDAAYGAGRLYMAFVVAGELALFAGLLLAVRDAGSFLLADIRTSSMSATAAALVIGGFAVKLGIMPLHFWLPPAHSAAPVPASAVLSGAMIKAGLFGMLATLPLGMQALENHGTVLMAAGLATIFAAALLGVRQSSAKATLGFSSVSQMGIVALAIGAGLAAPEAWDILLPVVAFLAAHHALAKGALFLGVGVFAAADGTRARILTILLLAVPAGVLAGVVATSGSFGKEALKIALEAGSEAWLTWLTAALVASGLATTLLMARFGFLLWRHTPDVPPHLRSRPESIVAPFLTLATISVLLPMAWPIVAPGGVDAILDAGHAAPTPIILGGAIAFIAVVRAYALQIGAEEFRRRLSRPLDAITGFAKRNGNRIRGKVHRAARRVPSMLEERATALNLGHIAIAALIVTVLALETIAASGEVYDAPAARSIPMDPETHDGPGPQTAGPNAERDRP